MATPKRSSSARERVTSAGLGIVSETEAIAHAGGDREDVLQSSAKLDPDNFVAGVNPKTGASEHGLKLFRDRAVAATENRRARQAAGDFDRKVGTGENRNGIAREFFGEDFTHAHSCAVLNPFGAAHQDRGWVIHLFAKARCYLPQRHGRGDEDDQVRSRTIDQSTR